MLGESGLAQACHRSEFPDGPLALHEMAQNEKALRMGHRSEQLGSLFGSLFENGEWRSCD
jgi:hypothetical protein